MIPFQPREFLHQQRERLHQRYVRGWKSQAIFEFFTFGIKQAWACLFGGLMLALLLLTFVFYPEPSPLPRYDFITLAAIGIQVSLLLLKLETLEEAKIIFVFHVVGTVMEIFKTHVGSWVYPEHSYLNILGVPMFSGFMYASVGSFIARVWRIFDFRFDRFPPLTWQALLALLIYINFFSHHYTVDIRWGLFLASAVLYGPALIWFKADEKHRVMPLIVGLLLVAIFIWFAENIGTYARAWTYPSQKGGWHMVSWSKLGSWYLLMLISFVLVAWVHKPLDRRLHDAKEAGIDLA
jgi:uncharacterized membrane protein YoaT (DUF817 family)